MPLSIDNRQTSLALTQFVSKSGIFPGRDSGPGSPTLGIPLGAIRTFGGNFGVNNSPLAEGQLLSISQNIALFSLLGTNYGGDGRTTFALPDLVGATMIGVGQGPGLSDHVLGEAIGSDTYTLTNLQLPASLGGSSQPINNIQPSLPITYLIRTAGTVPSANAGSISFIGQMVQFAGNFVPDGFLEAAGQILSIAAFPDLFSVIGTTYGGDGATTFALPDLRGRDIIGASSQTLIGTVLGQEEVVLSNANLPVSVGGSGALVENRAPSLAMNYLISLTGIFPSHEGSGAADLENQYLGEIVPFAGNFAPKGWALANGQLLSIAQNQPLFSLLGTMYGGDGRTTFALPDLRDRIAVGTGDLAPSDPRSGQLFGNNTTTILSSEIPDVQVTGTSGPNTLYGADGNDTLTGAGGNDTLNAGIGRDMAVYSGPRASYAITRNGDGSITVLDNRNGSPDGTDVLNGVERLRFSNTLIPTVPIGDYTGDFNADLLWRDASTNALTVWNLSGGQFSQSTTLGGIGSNIQVAGNGDFNGNGISDVLLRDRLTGRVTDWTVSNGQFVASFTLGGVGSNIDVIGAGDFNGDGVSDVLLRDRTTGGVSDWQINANDLFNSSHALGGIGSNIDVVGAGDFNGDGVSDVLLRDRTTGAVSEWQINSNNTFNSAHVLGGIGSNIDVVGTGDFNGDGTSDVLLRDRTTGAVSYWAVVNNAFAGSTQIGGVGSNFQIGGARDVNGDGFADVLLRDTTTGAVGAFTVVNGGFQQYVALGGVGSNIQFVG